MRVCTGKEVDAEVVRRRGAEKNATAEFLGCQTEEKTPANSRSADDRSRFRTIRTENIHSKHPEERFRQAEYATSPGFGHRCIEIDLCLSVSFVAQLSIGVSLHDRREIQKEFSRMTTKRRNRRRFQIRKGGTNGETAM